MRRVFCRFRVGLLALLATCLIASPTWARGTYLTLDQMLQSTFEGTPAGQALWLKPDQKQAIEQLLEHPFHKARIKYWQQGDRNLWVLSEIGKEKPITFAVVTSRQVLERIDVMAFREVRGDEIRLPAYTAQFRQQTLTDDDKLTEPVDGISGATYSVRSMKKVARLALLLDRWTLAGE